MLVHRCAVLPIPIFSVWFNVSIAPHFDFFSLSVLACCLWPGSWLAQAALTGPLGCTVRALGLEEGAPLLCVRTLHKSLPLKQKVCLVPSPQNLGRSQTQIITLCRQQRPLCSSTMDALLSQMERVIQQMQQTGVQGLHQKALR